MSLQRRLTLFFVVIVVVPLAAAGVIAQRIVGREIDERTTLALGPALDAAIIVYNERLDALDVRLRAAVGGTHFTRLLKTRARGPIDSYLSEALSRSHGVDFLGIVDNRSRVLGFVRQPGHFAPGFDEPSPDRIAASSAVSPGFVKSEIPIRIADDRTAHRLIGGFWLDEELLTRFSGEDVDLSLVAGERVTASTLDFEEPRRVDVSFRGPFEAQLNGSAAAQAREIDSGVAYVASIPIEGAGASTPVWSSIAALLLLALLATSGLAFLLARLITKPLEELAEGAQAIAESQFDHNIPVRSHDEVGRLAVAFNDMASKLQDTVDELSTSRDQL
ncbi:MAG: cell wall metabolism sensor histidine kinase WalK, partial [Actinomycetota bacterium]|nr:cell wall metabolism sensor histidine kinase WalK [Actinomycetota bacterium]